MKILAKFLGKRKLSRKRNFANFLEQNSRFLLRSLILHMDVIHGICFLAENMKKANTVAVLSYEVKYM